MIQTNVIHTGDCLQSLSVIPSNSIDLTVTSPPYNLGGKTGNMGKWSRDIVYDDYQDNRPVDEYISWQREILSELWRVTKETGAIYYNHKPRIQNGIVDTRLNLIPPHIPIRQIIIWNRPKGHNFNRGYFVPSYEFIFVLAKRKYQLGKGQSGYGDVWTLNPARNDHHAPFPIDIPLRAISASDNCEIVLDPFMGSGTTALAANALGKKWIGMELTQKWVDYSYKRIEDETESVKNNLPEYLKYFVEQL